MPPGRKKQAKINAAAQARTAWLEKFKKPADENFDLAVDTNDIPEMISISSDITDTEGDWDGTVNYCPSSDSEFCWTDTEDSDSDTSVTFMKTVIIPLIPSKLTCPLHCSLFQSRPSGNGNTE